MLFKKIYDDGIIEYKNYFVKIIKIIPINYDLKSNLEKEAILNSYKLFLKTCDFDIQIVIQSKKENLSKHISNIENYIFNEKNSKIIEIAENYIKFINEKNNENKSSSKNFYMVIKSDISIINKEKNDEDINTAKSILSENYLKIKECLTRCGNLVQEVKSRQETKNIMFSFYRSSYISNNESI